MTESSMLLRATSNYVDNAIAAADLDPGLSFAGRVRAFVRRARGKVGRFAALEGSDT
jgi:hypothetical protein